MEPVPPIAQPDAQPAAPARGPIARVKGAVGGFFAGGSPDSAQASITNPPEFPEPAPTTPGLQPRPDTTPAAVVPSPWATTDAAPAAGFAIAGQTPGLTRELQGPTLAHDMLSNPAASFDMTASTTSEPAAVEPSPTPAPKLTAEPVVVPAATQTEPTAASAPEPVAAPAPEPSPAVAPVWTPDASPTQPITAIEPDMRPSSSPSVEPTTTTTAPEDASIVVPAEVHADQVKTPKEPPLIRKVVEGDLIRYEFTPEGKAKLTAEITKAIESGALDNLANVFANEQAVELGAQATEITAPSADPMAGIESDALRAINQGTPGNPTPISSSFS